MITYLVLLDTYALFDMYPPFTSEQSAERITPDLFQMSDWPKIFGLRATPLAVAFAETLQHSIYSSVELEF